MWTCVVADMDTSCSTCACISHRRVILAIKMHVGSSRKKVHASLKQELDYQSVGVTVRVKDCTILHFSK